MDKIYASDNTDEDMLMESDYRTVSKQCGVEEDGDNEMYFRRNGITQWGNYLPKQNRRVRQGQHNIVKPAWHQRSDKKRFLSNQIFNK